MKELHLNPDTMHGTLSWVVASAQPDEWVIADLIAHEIDPHATSAIEMIASPSVTIATLVRAKQAFKTLRLEGESAEDRRLGSILYTAAIAAAIVQHRERITRQRDALLQRAMSQMHGDISLPVPLRVLAGEAFVRLSAAS